MLSSVKEKLEAAGFNTSEGLKRCMNDENFYFEVMFDLLKDTCYERMLQAIQDKNVKEAYETGHSLKGAISNLSMNTLFQELNPMVEILKQNSFEGIELYLDKVKVLYEQGIKAIREIEADTHK